MNQYQVFCEHNICEDSYTEGEMGTYNSYDDKAIIKADTPMAAIRAFYEKNLFWDFKEEGALFDEGKLFDSRLIDEENHEASERQIEEWMAGKIQLYSDNVRITVMQLGPVNIFVL